MAKKYTKTTHAKGTAKRYISSFHNGSDGQFQQSVWNNFGGNERCKRQRECVEILPEGGTTRNIGNSRIDKRSRQIHEKRPNRF